MADNIQFSFTIEGVTGDEALWFKERVEREADEDEGVLIFYTVGSDSHGLFIWIRDGGYGNVQEVREVLGDFLREHRPDQVITFSWTETRPTPRGNSYGGGAAVITAVGARWTSTWQWMFHAKAAAARKLKIARGEK